ncbi:MAG: HNH endonuclease [Deltaproteobacteria bacterium]|nr:MAG: HNH endonuclease [Deltaproteobacteria bacterium]
MEAVALVRAVETPDAEVRLAALARSGAPVRRVLAALAGQLVAAKTWDPLGYVRLRDYAVERLGLSARQVQDLAHVDRVLQRLPLVDAAFIAGNLTWTKVRLLCRVATAEDEARWIQLAQRLTARALAREVRAVDARSLEAGGAPETDEDGAEEVPRETVWLHVTPRVRARWSRARLLARRVAGEALSQAAVAEVIAAEVMSALGIDVDPGPLALSPSPSQSPSRPREPRAKPSTLSPNLPAFLAPLLENLESPDAIELDARLRRALRIEQRLLAEMAPLLLEVARSRAYRAHGCSSLALFARERLGMSPRKAQALLRLERAGSLCPEVRAAFRSGGLSWVQAHALVPILALEHSQPSRAAWVAHAASVSVRRLEEDVERALVTGQLDPRSLSEDVQTGAHPTLPNETIKLFFTAPADVARVFKSVLATVQRRIERRTGRTAGESEALDAMLEHCFATWAPANAKIPSDHRVFERDGWRCTVPGCSSYRNLHSHHILFRSDQGPDDPWNRTALCAAHHHRCVHEGIGRIRIRGCAPDGLRFEMPLATYGPGERVLR